MEQKPADLVANMLMCVLIVGQVFLLDEYQNPVNFNAYERFNVEESWDQYYVTGTKYDGNTNRWKVDGEITKAMIPSLINHCADTAK